MKKALILLLFFFILRYAANAQTSAYVYTGGVQTYTVPSGITNLTVDARGACGGQASYFYYGVYDDVDLNRGGYGGRVVCSLTVTPGQILYVYVGGNGDTTAFHSTTASVTPAHDTAHGGWNGGGNSTGYTN